MIRVTPALLERWRLPRPNEELGKKGRGHVLVIGGSAEIPGAAILGAVGALRAGAGTLEIATARPVAGQVAVAVPEARVRALPASRTGEIANLAPLYDDLGAVDTILVGPGMRGGDATGRLLARAKRARTRATFIIDAGALDALGDDAPGVHAILTPHAGEMAKLCDLTLRKVMADPEAIARQVAVRYRAVVALKGAATYVVAPDGRTWLNTAGNVGLGTSGSGDTLSGVIAGLCARGAAPEQAAVWGVYLHAKAGDRLARRMGQLGFLARELLDEIPPLLARLSTSRRA